MGEFILRNLSYLNILDTINREDEPYYIKISEACKYTNIGRNTMLKLAKMKGFPALISSKKILIDKEQLPIWLSKNYSRYVN